MSLCIMYKKLRIKFDKMIDIPFTKRFAGEQFNRFMNMLYHIVNIK